MTPNKIAGMKLRGIGRAPSNRHIKKEARAYLKYMALVRKKEREQQQYKKANREYAI
jgi:hypothetical protein